MSEAEWLACENPGRMILWLDNNATMRKLRLFACASCRRIWHLVTDNRLQEIVEVADGIADGLISVTGETFTAAQQRAFDALNAIAIRDTPRRLAARAVIEAAFHAWGPSLALGTAITAKKAKFASDRIKHRIEEQCQAGIVCDIFGNPFRPVAINPAWLSPKVTSLAHTIYADRAFDKMPALADALQEAGCDNQDIVSHCRGSGPHVKGCWVVDLVLGKE